MHPTSSESNYRNSIKKYFKDALETGQGIQVSFDGTVDDPQKANINQWVIFAFGQSSITDNQAAWALLDVHLCSRKDAEGTKLASLRDSVMDLLTDTVATDTTRRIPLYQTSEQPWTRIGSLMIRDVQESLDMQLPDRTKYKTMIVKLRWMNVA